jgi:serine/threonine protein kinase
MKLVEGTDLEARVRSEGPHEPSDAVHIVQQVARAVDAAHREGLVHRDVRPTNVLLAGEGREAHPYPADFGLIQRTHPTGANRAE